MKSNDKYIITEECLGYWHYHISEKENFTKSLCGKKITMMRTNIPFSSWGTKSKHFYKKEKYCEDCKKIHNKQIL